MLRETLTVDRVGADAQGILGESGARLSVSSGLDIALEAPLVLELRFEFDRTGPIALRAEPCLDFVRTGDDVWEAELRAAPTADEPLRLRWIDPIRPARLKSAVLVAQDERARPAEREEDVVARYEKALGAFRGNGAVEVASRFWLSLDLATAFQWIEGQTEAVAKRLSISPSLYGTLDPVRMEGLAWFLESRWRIRGTVRAARGGHVLVPPAAGFQRTAEDAARLMLAVAGHFFPPRGQGSFDLRGLWMATLLFASGRLRRNSGGPRLNIEPNSASIASFAEVFDIAGDQENCETLSNQEYQDCGLLRVVFASMLEPYFEVYRSPKRTPRRAHLYTSQNLDRALRQRDPRWSDDMLQSLMKRYGRALRAVEAELPWLRERWGTTLAEGLRDEPRVLAAGS